MSTLKAALRGVVRSGRLSLAAAACIALGAAATGAVAALVDATLLRPLPFPAAERLVRVWHEEEGADPRVALSIPEIDELRGLPAFDAVLAASRMRIVALFDDGAHRLRGEAVTPEYLGTLGIAPQLGRVLAPADFASGAPPAAVLSHAAWTTRYAADPGVVGRSLRTASATFTVVGVTRPGFAGTVEDDIVEFFVPLPQYLPAAIRAERRVRGTWVVLRQREGVSRAEAKAQIAAWGAASRDQHPDVYRRLRPRLEPMGENWRAGLRSGGALLAGSAGLLLLVAAANVAGLLAARALARRRELAVLAALGASRRRLITLTLCETLLVVAAGGALGMALATPLLRVFLTLSPVTLPTYLTLTPDWRVVLLSCAVLAVAALAAGVGPAWIAARVDPGDVLRASGRGTVGGRGERRFATLLVAAEAGFTLVLLVSGGLLLRSWQRLERSDLGIDADSVLRLALTVSPLDLPTTDALPAFRARIKETLGAEPGVRGVTVMWPTLPPWDSYRPRVVYDGLDPVSAPEGAPVSAHAVDPDLLPSLGIRLIAGRNIEPADEASRAAVAVVSESFARRFGGPAQALGREVTVLPEEEGEPRRPFRIVGVARDAAWDGLADETRRLVRVAGRDDPRIREDLYLPLALFPNRLMSIGVVAGGDPAALLEPLRRRLGRLAPASAVHWNETLREGLRGEYAPSRFYALLVAAFSASALGLTGVGLFASLSHFVTRRTSEIGVRMALGASPGRVRALVLAAGLSPLLAGLAVGGAVAALAARSISGLLYGVEASDLAAFAFAGLALLVVALPATLLPARRAAALSPVQALRVE